MQEHKTTKLVQARLARHARLDSLDKVERVESSRVEPSGIWAILSTGKHS